MRSSVLTRRPLFFAAVAAGLLFLLWLRLYQPPNTVDDAYITFRYARNLATGVGFVYNAGERVLGTTTPAYAMLLALAARVSGFDDYPRLALVVNALLNGLAFCVLIRLTTRLSGRPWVGLGAALLFAIEGRGLDFSTGGMEAGFNQLAILATFVLLFENRTRWAAAALGLAVLIRPDGLNLAAAFFGVLGLEGLRRKRPLPWIEGAIFAAVVLPWVLFATAYFGNFIPQSILAKSELYRTPELMAFRAFLVQIRALWPFSVPPLVPNQSLGRELAQAVLPAALAAVGLYAAQRRQPRAYAIGVYMLLFIAFYSVGNPLWLGWYEIPLFPLYLSLFLTGLAWLGARVVMLLRQEPPPSPGPFPRGKPPQGKGSHSSTARVGAHALAAVGVALLAVPHLSRLNVLPWEPRERPAWVLNPAFNKQRETDYRLLARMLAPAARSDRLVAIPEIGAFGYVYGGDLFDTAGLISPATNDYFPIPAEVPFEIYAVPRQLIFDLQPDLFISFDSMLVGDLKPDDAEFLAQFRPTIGMVSHAAFGIQRLMVYRRADLPVEVTLPPPATPAAVSFGEGLVTLRGYELRPWSDPETDYLEVTLYWQAGAAPPNREVLARVNLLTAGGEQAFQVLDFPGETLFPTSTWAPGQWLVDRYQLKRPQPAAGPYTVTVTLFTTDSDFALPAVGADGARLAEDTLIIDADPEKYPGVGED